MVDLSFFFQLNYLFFSLYCFFYLFFLAGSKSLFNRSDLNLFFLPLINLEDLSPTFEEDKDELENVNEKNVNLYNNDDVYEQEQEIKKKMKYL